MAGGADLLGAAIEAPRKRGRPKGSTNRRAKDLQGFIAAKYGASAAQQSAALCMVTPGELKAAGGSMARAQVAKAEILAAEVRQAQDRGNVALRELVKDALRELAADLANGDKVKDLVSGFLHRVKEGTAGFGIVQALKLIADERSALLPYTDQRQAQAVTVTAQGLAPSVVIMGDGSAQLPAPAMDAEFVEVFEPPEGEVSRLKSHDEGQALVIPGVLPPPAAD